MHFSVPAKQEVTDVSSHVCLETALHGKVEGECGGVERWKGLNYGREGVYCTERSWDRGEL